MNEIKTIIGQIGIMSLIGLVTLLTLVSCGGGGGSAAVVEDDLQAIEGVTDDTTPISFSCGLAESQAVVRSGSMLSAERDAFKVWGHKNMSFNDKNDADPSNDEYGDMQTVFPGYTVSWVTNTAYTTSSNTSDWEYVGGDQTIKFWDWSAKAYRFFAVTDVDDVTAGLNDPSDPKGPYKITMNTDATSTTAINALPYFSHLWFSTGDPVAYADKQFGKPVVLEFLKPLTRVRFIFKYVYPREGITLSEVNFKPTVDYTVEEASKVKIARKGTFTVIYPLTGTETREWFTVTDIDADTRLDAFTEDFDPEDDTKVYTKTDNGWYMVLPNNTQGSYTLSAKVNKASKTAVVPANYMQWLPGYSYTYIFKITEEGGIEIGWVEYAMTPWTEQLGTWTVYNW